MQFPKKQKESKMNFKFSINKKANIAKLKFKAGIGRCTAALHITGKASKYKGFHGGAFNSFLRIMWCNIFRYALRIKVSVVVYLIILTVGHWAGQPAAPWVPAAPALAAKNAATVYVIEPSAANKRMLFVITFSTPLSQFSLTTRP